MTHLEDLVTAAVYRVNADARILRFHTGHPGPHGRNNLIGGIYGQIRNLTDGPAVTHVALPVRAVKRPWWEHHVLRRPEYTPEPIYDILWMSLWTGPLEEDWGDWLKPLAVMPIRIRSVRGGDTITVTVNPITATIS